MTFSDQYPYKPPGFRFRIPIFHPNIYADGKLCISILRGICSFSLTQNETS